MNIMSERPKKFLQMIPIRESLLKGENQYNRSPGAKYFKLAPFRITKKIFFSTKQAILMKMLIVLNLPLRQGFPYSNLYFQLWLYCLE
jgi:hypothetical protein